MKGTGHRHVEQLHVQGRGGIFFCGNIRQKHGVELQALDQMHRQDMGAALIDVLLAGNEVGGLLEPFELRGDELAFLKGFAHDGGGAQAPLPCRANAGHHILRHLLEAGGGYYGYRRTMAQDGGARDKLIVVQGSENGIGGADDLDGGAVAFFQR